MDVEDWIKVGPGYRLRDGSEAEVLATDMGRDGPVLIRYRRPTDSGVWIIGYRRGDGRVDGGDDPIDPIDLIRPVEVSDEAVAAYVASYKAAVRNSPDSYSDAAVARGRRAGLDAAFAVMLRARGLE